uniref:Peptidase S1 domain-containing protein n=1 Tax=Elaeophora elaphi TaxID=1147741 RepID=A0A0R3RJ68_9BILA
MISDRHILTAAHCFVQKDCERGAVTQITNSKQWKVYYGGGCLPFAKHTCPTFQQIARSVTIKNIAIPASYLTESCLHNDIAIVTVKLKMVLIYFLNLTFTKFLYSRGSDPTKMRKATALATINVTRVDCIPEMLITDEVSDQLCTSELQEGNMCSGDSGAGLMYKTGDDIWNVVGVASAGTDCRIINIALNMKDEEGMPVNGISLDGSVFIDLRAHSRFICQYAGLCFGSELDNQRKIKAVIL